MNDFLETASRLLSTNDVSGKNEHFERVFKAISSLQVVHSKAQLDLNNIESVYTAIEIANVLGKLPDSNPEEIPNVIASLKELIVITLERTISFPTRENRILPPNVYNRFAKLILYLRKDAYPNHSVSVISFNYDIALDLAMSTNGLGPSYGFGPRVHANYLTPLLKLHGSLNWAVTSNTRTVQPLTLQEYFSKYGLNNLEEIGSCHIPIGSKLQEYYSKHKDLVVNAEPAIVPPVWNKADYHQSLKEVWGTAAGELAEAEYVFIMGYSLPETDSFFRLLFGLGTVGTKLFKKVIVYNPDESGVVENRFKKMMGPGALARFEYKSKEFNWGIEELESMFSCRR